MKALLEKIPTDSGSSFKTLLNPNLNDIFYWHFHPEYEIVYVDNADGVRHIGNHISRYAGSDLALIGPNIPHLNFDYGVTDPINTVVIQMKEDFLGEGFFSLPEMASIADLFSRARGGLAFYGETKRRAGARLRQLNRLPPFEQLMSLMRVFRMLAVSREVESLDQKPLALASVGKEQQRLQRIYHYIETRYAEDIDVNELAAYCHMTTPAFCRYFRKATRHTFTDFLNRFRINQAKRSLVRDMTVTEACFENGFTNISYFNRVFKRMTGENPSAFRRRHAGG